MRRLIIVPVLIVTIAIAYTAYNTRKPVQIVKSDVERADNPPTTNISSLVASNTEFAFDLYQQIASEEDGNLIFSPYSISQAFAMVYAGARGETESQMADTLNFILPQDQFHAAFNAIDLILQPSVEKRPTPVPADAVLIPPQELTLNIANSIWGQQGFPFEQAYLDTLAANYGAGLQVADFSTDSAGARETIRQWVDDATEGRITDMPPAEAITPQTRLALINAIYFKADWTYKFDARKTYDAAFHLADDSEVTVPMMVNDFAYMACVVGDGYHAVQLTYGASEGASMLILLPDTGNFANFETTLNAELFNTVQAGLKTTNALIFEMPRFDFEAEIDLQEILSAMGMSLPFSAEADFTGISSNGLFINYASHKATISVDELGTEASGITSVGLAIAGVGSSCGRTLTADRPFIFVIADDTTGSVLFMGRVMNPVE